MTDAPNDAEPIESPEDTESGDGPSGCSSPLWGCLLVGVVGTAALAFLYGVLAGLWW